MAGQSNSDALSQTVDAFAQKIQDYASGIASRLGGQPLSGQQLSKEDVVARWNYTPLGDTAAADAQYHQLVAQGTPPGQALNQVYPMRSLLFSGGADLNDSIAIAKQIAGWAADATGTDVASPPQGSTLPLLMAAQRMAGGAAQNAPAMPAPAPGGMPAAPMPAPGPVS
jgi:hypothetical protein